MKRISFILCALLTSFSSFIFADDIFVANNGVTLINIPEDQSVKTASFSADFDLNKVKYDIVKRNKDDKYLMHCFTKKERLSNDYINWSEKSQHICLNETGKKLQPNISKIVFPDFKIVKQDLGKKSVGNLVVNFKGRNTVISTLTNNSNLPVLNFDNNSSNKNFVYSYYSFDPNNGELVNGTIYEYY